MKKKSRLVHVVAFRIDNDTKTVLEEKGLDLGATARAYLQSLAAQDSKAKKS